MFADIFKQGGGDGMSKAEIALQLVLKAMESNYIGLSDARVPSDANAKKIYEFYNELFTHLRTDNPE